MAEEIAGYICKGVALGCTIVITLTIVRLFR